MSSLLSVSVLRLTVLCWHIFHIQAKSELFWTLQPPTRFLRVSINIGSSSWRLPTLLTEWHNSRNRLILLKCKQIYQNNFDDVTQNKFVEFNRRLRVKRKGVTRWIWIQLLAALLMTDHEANSSTSNIKVRQRQQKKSSHTQQPASMRSKEVD